MVLSTARLRLRPLVRSDASWISREIAVPEVHRWLTSPPRPYERHHADHFIETFASNDGFRVIELGDEPLGVISIETAARFDPDRPALPELGYWLKVSAWGQGIASEAAQAMLDWHDKNRGSQVHSGYLKENSASANVLKKLGFTDLGATRRWSAFHGTEVIVNRVIREPVAQG